jgi:hypothetical protein
MKSFMWKSDMENDHLSCKEAFALAATETLVSAIAHRFASNQIHRGSDI